MTCAMLQLRLEIAITIFTIAFSSTWADPRVEFNVFSGDACTTSEGGPGICKNIRKCDQLLGLLIHSRPPPQVMETLRRSHCGFEGKDTLVCCPIVVKQKKPRVNENANGKKKRFETFVNGSCGVIQTLNRVFGGRITARLEFPWMALIGYNTSFGLQYRCGGSLISPHYILTAAHCVSALTDLYPISVRLGEYDMESSENCNEKEDDDDDDEGKKNNECDYPVEDIPIQEVIPHPEYSKKKLRNDIALLRLAKRVEYTNHIRPICLPLNKGLRIRSLLNIRAVVAGWGATELTGTSTTVLRKVTLPIIPLEKCSEVYKKRAFIHPEMQICAGGEQGKDSCRGDSGGPLQVTGSNPEGELAYIQLGIVSFGPLACGTKGVPGVYTRVAHYVDWILENMKE